MMRHISPNSALLMSHGQDRTRESELVLEPQLICPTSAEVMTTERSHENAREEHVCQRIDARANEVGDIRHHATWSWVRTGGGGWALQHHEERSIESSSEWMTARS